MKRLLLLLSIVLLSAGYVRVPVPADTPSELVRTVSLSLSASGAQSPQG